jgi:hypothetical protein
MSDTTLLYGASDDLIEVDGPFVREEFDANFSDPAAIAVFDRSDADGGSLLARIRYDEDGCWRINVLRGGEFSLRPARGEDADNDADGVPGYSDRLEVHGRVGFVVVANAESVRIVHAPAKAGA